MWFRYAPLVCAALLFFIGSSDASTVWHVNAVRGSDKADGRSASPTGSSGPLRSLHRLGEVIRAGDTAVLACGSTWRESLSVRGGSTAAPITIVAENRCAPGSRPTIDPRQALPFQASAGWREAGILSATVGAVFVGDALLQPAMLGGTPWLALPAQSPGTKGSSEIALPAAIHNKADYLQGAVIAIRTVPYRVERRRIVAVASSGAIRLDFPTHYPVKEGTPFFIEQIAEPTLSGWASNANGQLLVRLSEQPKSAVSWVRASPSVLSEGTLILRGVSVVNAGEDAIRISRGAGSRLEDVRIDCAVRDGIHLVDSENSIVTESVVRNVGRDAIRFENSGRSSAAFNEIERVGMGATPTDIFAAINAETSSNMRIRGNRMRSIAYLGIRFKRNTVVEENLIDRACVRLPDCGAIYGWARLDPQLPFSSRLTRNVIRNIGSDEPLDVQGNPIAAGIYLDDLASGVTVDANVVENSQSGIFLHNSTMNIVQNNQILYTRDCAICMVGGIDVDTVTAMGNNFFKSNVLLPAPGGTGYRMFSRFGLPDWRRISGEVIVHETNSPVVVIETSDKVTRLMGKSMRAGNLLGDEMAAIHTYIATMSGAGEQISTAGSFGVSGDSVRKMASGSGNCANPNTCGRLTSGGGFARLYSAEYPALQNDPLAVSFVLRGALPDAGAIVELRASEAPYDLLAEVARISPGYVAGSRIALSIPGIHIRKRWRLHVVTNGTTEIEVSDFKVLKGVRAVPSVRSLVNETPSAKRINCSDWKLSDCSKLRSISGGRVDAIDLPPHSAIVAIESNDK